MLKSDAGSLLDKHFEQIGMSLSWVSDPQSATDWVTSFEMGGGSNSLVSQVDAHSRVATGLFEAIADADAQQSPMASRFLDVTAHRIQPMSDQKGVPFWDPRVASDYFEYIQTAPQKVLPWFCMRDGAQKIECIIGDHRAVADAWCATPRWSEIEGIEKTARPILSAAEMNFFETTKVEKFVRSTRTWILKNYGNGQEKTDEVDQFVRMQVRLLLTTGIRSEYAQLYVIAGCFLMGCHVTELPEQMGGILQKERTGQRERSELFLKTVLEQRMVSYG